MGRGKFQFFVGIGFHVFFIHTSGKLMAFGGNGHGQLSLEDFKNRKVPSEVSCLNGACIINVSTGKIHSLVLSEGGVYSSGCGLGGRLSLGDDEKRNIAKRVILEDEGIRISQIFAGFSVSFFLTTSGIVYSCGYNRHGVLCLGDSENRLIGTRIRHLKDKIKEISVYDAVFFLSESGSIYCGGKNHRGQLGVGNTTNQHLPVELTFFKDLGINVKSIVSGAFTTYFQCDEGRIFITGSNRCGQHGNGQTSNPPIHPSIPHLSKSIKNVDQLCAGGEFAAWRTIRGEFFGTGGNRGKSEVGKKGGHLGLGKRIKNCNVPTKIPLKNFHVSQVFAFSKGLYFLDEKGEILYGTGNGDFGQLLGKKSFYRVNKLSENLGVRIVEEDDETSIDTVSEELENERLQFVLSLPSDLKIQFNDASLEVFRSILDPESRNSKRVKGSLLSINRYLRHTLIESELILSTFFGVNFQEQFNFDVENCLRVFLFFQAMGMRQYEYAVLKAVSFIADLKSLVILFVQAFKLLEPQSENGNDIDLLSQLESPIPELTFDSYFNLNLFNLLAERKDEIHRNEPLLRVLERLNVWSSLTTFIPKSIENLAYYDNQREFSFNKLFQNHCQRLFYHRKKSSNYIIVSVDEKEIHAHKEIIALKSDYFCKVIKFGGRETRKEGYLILERLNYAEILLLVEFIYLGSVRIVKNDDFLGVLMNLLVEIVPYSESVLQKELTDKIKSLTAKEIEEGVFLEKGLVQIGHYFSELRGKSLPEEVWGDFVNDWKKKVEFGKLKHVFDKSAMMKQDMQNEVEREGLEERVKGVEERMKGMEEQAEHATKRIGSNETLLKEMKSEVCALKESMNEVLQILKGSDEDDETRKRKKSPISGDGGEMKRKLRKRN